VALISKIRKITHSNIKLARQALLQLEPLKGLKVEYRKLEEINQLGLYTYIHANITRKLPVELPLPQSSKDVIFSFFFHEVGE
jgi:hypothetical protein